jgi:mRNA-degrading endonuclease HigB of HigAB toxin-antitoxin module
MKYLKRFNENLDNSDKIHIPEAYSGVRMELGEFASPEDIMDTYNNTVAREDIPQLTGYWDGIFYTEDDVDTTLDAVLDELNYAIGLDSSESFVFESKDGRPKLYNELVRPLKDLYNESDDKTKETFKDLSNNLFKNPKDIVNMFTDKISKFKTLDELTKSLKSFLKIVDDLKK